MSRNPRILSIIAAVLVGSALIVGVSRLGRAPRDFPQTVYLPDGSKLTVTGVTFGTNHVSPGLIPQRVIDLLPKKLAAALKISSREKMTSPTLALGVWFDFQQGTNPAAQADFAISFADESGLESSDTSIWLSGTSPPPFHGVTVDAFPRRSPTIRMNLYRRPSYGQQVRVATYQFANPAYTQYPDWRAGPAMARTASGDFEATILKLLVGNSAGLREPIGNDEWLSGRATFELKFRGNPTTNWSVERIEMSDATGNMMTQNQWSHSATGGEIAIRFAPALWPDGSAWKIRAEFVRRPTAEFDADELVTFKDVPIPPAGSASYGVWKTNLQGQTLTLNGLVGAGGNLTTARSRPYTQSLKPDERLIVAAINSGDSGVNLSIVNLDSDRGKGIEAQWSGTSDGEYQFKAAFPANATTANITFAVHKGRHLEFMVKPELVTTNRARTSSGQR